MIINEILEKSMKHSIENIKMSLPVGEAGSIIDKLVTGVGAYCGVSADTVSKWESNPPEVKMATFTQLIGLLLENGIHIDVADELVKH
jgi:hypothetical protein